MKDSTYQILNDSKYLEQKQKIFNTLQDFYDGKKSDKTIGLNGLLFYPMDVDPYTQPEIWTDHALDFMAEHAGRIFDEGVLRPLAFEFGLYGVHFVDKIFGADVYQLDGMWNARYLTTEIGQLQKPDLNKNDTFLLAKRVAECFMSKNVKLPVFGLPTIASALNIAVNLYGEKVFYSFYEDPDAIRHDLEVINETLIELHKYYLNTIPYDQLQPVVSWERTQPYGCGQLCGCSTQMLSGDTYREFLFDLDNALLGTYKNPGMIHLCGTHLQHLENFRDMKNLKALQLHNRAAQDLEYYLKGLRDDQVVYVNCCVEMPYEKALEISKGDRVIFVGEYPSVRKNNEKNS